MEWVNAKLAHIENDHAKVREAFNERSKNRFPEFVPHDIQRMRDEIQAFGKPVTDSTKQWLANKRKELPRDRIPLDLAMHMGLV
jgi:hypothetical protein